MNNELEEFDAVDEEVDAVDLERYEYCCDCEHLVGFFGNNGCSHESGGHSIENIYVEKCDNFKCIYCEGSPCICYLDIED